METNATDAKCESARRDAKGSPSVSYTPGPDASPEGELTALANVYRFLLDRRESSKKRFLLDRRERRDDDIAADGPEERGEHAK